MNKTKLTGLEVDGDLEVTGGLVASGLTEATYLATSSDGTAAAGEAPTKAEFDAVVTLVNELKSVHNKLVKQLLTGSDT